MVIAVSHATVAPVTHTLDPPWTPEDWVRIPGQSKMKTPDAESGVIHQCVSTNRKERALKIKQAYPVLAAITVAGIAFLYGLSPQWFARSFLGVRDLDVNLAHILRAVMGLYVGFSLFWLFSAQSNRQRNTAVLTTWIFAAGLVSGRIISLVFDGLPSPLLVGYTVAELAILPVAYWVYRLPEGSCNVSSVSHR